LLLSLYLFQANTQNINNVGACPENCYQCTLQRFCNICNVGYSVTSTGNCVIGGTTTPAASVPVAVVPTTSNSQGICPDHCFNCSSDGLTCLICSSGYVLLNNGSCYIAAISVCPANCILCSSDGLTCRSCGNGFILLSNGACFPISNIASNATSATGSTTNNTSASTTGNAVCSGLPNCEVCSNDGFTCLECNTGFAVLNNLCVAFAGSTSVATVPCLNNCASCLNDTETCQLCIPGFTLLTNGSCVATCSANCISCNNGVCSQCSTGFILQSNGTCKFGQITCPGNCLGCFGNGTCTNCSQFYTLKSDGSCGVDCPVNCALCTVDTLECTSCSVGFVLQTNGTCSFSIAASTNPTTVACPSDCEACSDSMTCAICSAGYTLRSNGRCTSTENICGNYCTKCTPDALTCYSCFSGYSLMSDSTCAIVCPTNCAVCSTQGVCVTCSSGFTLQTDRTCTSS